MNPPPLHPHPSTSSNTARKSYPRTRLSIAAQNAFWVRLGTPPAAGIFEEAGEAELKTRVTDGQPYAVKPDPVPSREETGDADPDACDRSRTAQHRKEASPGEEIERGEHQPELEEPFA